MWKRNNYARLSFEKRRQTQESTKIMIEFRVKTAGNNNDWVQIVITKRPKGALAKLVNFEEVQIRIDGIVYSENSQEFEEVFDKAILWEILNY